METQERIFLRKAASHTMGWPSPALGLALLLFLPQAPAHAATIIADGESVWQIAVERDAGDIERFAAQELSRYLEATSGVFLPVVEERSAEVRAIQIRAGQAETDGYRLVVEPEKVTIEGEGPRGVLYGVYGILRSLGYRWYFPGKSGEVIPRLTTITLPDGIQEDQPSFRERSLIWDIQYAGAPETLHGKMLDWIDWAGKQRLNQYTFFACEENGWRLDKWWAENRHRLLPEMRKRGILLGYGGHFLSTLLPRHLFEDHPEYFRMDREGKRVNDFNFCPTNAGARRVVQENALAYFKRYPEAKYFHLWADDIRGGGWCNGPECRGLSASDQAMIATNSVAQALADADPGAALAYLAYHDTTVPPTKVQADANVFLLNAARERCNAHSLDDPNCARNRQIYKPAFETLLALFEKTGRNNSHMFEYFQDHILFKTMQPPLLGNISGSARYFRDLKLPVLQSLVVVNRNWVSPPLSLYAFSEMAWDADASPGEIVEDFARFFAPDSRMTKYFEQVEEAFRLSLAVDDFTDGFPYDVLHFDIDPRPVARAKLLQLDQALAIHQEAHLYLTEVARSISDSPYRERLERELAIAEMHDAALRLQRHRFAGWLLGTEFKEGNDLITGRRASTALQSALSALVDLGIWQARHEQNTYQIDFWRLHSRSLRFLDTWNRGVWDQLETMYK
jgi:hypothetical protein